MPRQERLALKFLDFGTSYWVYIDGELVLEVGQPGRYKRETIGQYKPQLIEFEPGSTRIELLFHVANFDHRIGGAWSPVILGEPKQIHRLRENEIALDLLLFGAIMMIGLINFAIFFLRRDNRASLFLALICVSAGIRILTVGERYGYLLFPNMTWELFSKVEYLSWFFLLPAFGHFMYHTFPREVNFKIMYLFDAISAIAILIVLATPLLVFSYSVPPMQILHLCALAYGAWCLIHAWRDNREGALVLIIGYVILSVTTINDMLVASWFLEGISISGIGILAFIICQSLLVIYRFTTTLGTVEDQHEELFSTNMKLQMQEKLRLEAENESRSVSQHFHQSQQFEALGILAHDVVSKLKTSFADASKEALVVARSTGHDPELVQSMENISRAAHQGIGVIEDVLSLSRLQDNKNQVLVNDVIKDFLKSPASAELREDSGITFEQSLSPNIRPISGSPLHIRRILENLVNNAVDSQPEGGRVSLGTEEVRVEARQLFYDEISEGPYVVLSVEDDGSGIAPEDLDMVFQPFFSRKEASQRMTGLGMSVVRAIVRQHNGGIDVESNAEQGTRFEIYLPVTRG